MAHLCAVTNCGTRLLVNFSSSMSWDARRDNPRPMMPRSMTSKIANASPNLVTIVTLLVLLFQIQREHFTLGSFTNFGGNMQIDFPFPPAAETWARARSSVRAPQDAINGVAIVLGADGPAPHSGPRSTGNRTFNSHHSPSIRSPRFNLSTPPCDVVRQNYPRPLVVKIPPSLSVQIYIGEDNSYFAPSLRCPK